MKFPQRIHNRLGDFWWYSLMLFCAGRAADLLNAFVGMWLIPKYVDPSELGAVMPLTNFANFLAIPAAVFANTFRNELTKLSVDKEFGRLKTLMRGVFIATAIFLFLAIIIARFTLPIFLERIRIVEGSLGLLIIISSFVATIAPVYTNALQALKKFRAQSLLSIIGAPVRLIAMLITMPFRALSGYFVGQAATPAFSIIAAVFCLKKELLVKAEPYWNRTTFRRFSTLFALFALGGIIAGFNTLIESTVLRQRLPDLDSAGFYMASRFSEIAAYLAGAFSITLFPMAAELATRHDERLCLVSKAMLANLAFCAAIGGVLFLTGRSILALLPHGAEYSAYWWAIPWLIAITAIGSIAGLYITAETGAGRFSWMKWYLPIDLGYPAILLLVTGYGYYAQFLPPSWASFLNAHNIRSLDTMLWWMTGNNLLKAMLCLIAMRRMATRRADSRHVDAVGNRRIKEQNGES